MLNKKFRIFILFSLSWCFRFVIRTGLCSRPTEPDFQHELYDPLRKTRCPLAEAGQPKGMKLELRLTDPKAPSRCWHLCLTFILPIKFMPLPIRRYCKIKHLSFSHFILQTGNIMAPVLMWTLHPFLFLVKGHFQIMVFFWSGFNVKGSKSEMIKSATLGFGDSRLRCESRVIYSYNFCWYCDFWLDCNQENVALKLFLDSNLYLLKVSVH